MKIQNLNLVYFSPTHTTQKILHAVAEGVSSSIVNDIDLTLKRSIDQVNKAESSALTIFGVPVYAGRVPPDAAGRIKQFKGEQSPAVIVVTYGNREYEDALLELKHIIEANGFIVIAAAAFIGEHSYSTANKPIAHGRPDTSDLDKARKFGSKISEKLSQPGILPGKVVPEIPGNLPYKDKKGLPGVIPITDPKICAECFDCAAVCPTQAIHPADSTQTDDTLCIRCCACVKSCPTGARQMIDPRIIKIMDFLFTNYSNRKEPEIFI